jgi:PTS system cellobiose-specific IIC component
VPAITGINEPIFFGTPLVLNIKLLVPLVVAPLVTSGLAIIATALNIVPRLNGIQVPLGTPIIMSGLIAGGWRVAVFQVVLAFVSAVVWYPFFRVIDKEAVAMEEEAKREAPATVTVSDNEPKAGAPA